MKKNRTPSPAAAGGRPDRLLRVNELIRRTLASGLERLIMPEENMFASVTDVSASIDLRNATVRVSIYGGSGEGKKQLWSAILRERIAFQRVIAEELGFKHTPVLLFKKDDRGEKADRVLAILNEGMS